MPCRRPRPPSLTRDRSATASPKPAPLDPRPRLRSGTAPRPAPRWSINISMSTLAPDDKRRECRHGQVNGASGGAHSAAIPCTGRSGGGLARPSSRARKPASTGRNNLASGEKYLRRLRGRPMRVSGVTPLELDATTSRPLYFRQATALRSKATCLQSLAQRS